ncbi:MAG: histidinol phosphate phosphatase [Burkholderiaceae bacterium]|nr:histidinol phosphate phosphatase [Burkholderiaceae bacterium]
MNLSELSVSELRALQEKIKQEMKKREENEIAEAKRKIQAIAQSVGLPLKDLLTASVRTAGSKVPPRYRHPEKNDLTWTGRGHQPVWVREWLAGGKSLEALRIK